MPIKNKEIVEEWKLLMPDFHFCFWNESNIEKYKSLFLEQCLKKKAYAFAADIVRLKVVNAFGGFYLDTDMKLLKRLQIDEGVTFEICEEEKGRPSWGYFYSIPGSNVLRQCLKKYDNLYFDQFKPPVIPYFVRDVIISNLEQVNLLDYRYFYPLPHGEDLNNIDKYVVSETVGVHLWDFSWSKLKKERSKYKEVIFRLSVLFFDLFSGRYPVYY